MYKALLVYFLQNLPVICSAETAELLLANDGDMYFKPTAVGTSSTQPYKIKNISRMPLEYKWVVKYDERDLVRVEETTGLIQPNEYQVII